jgi:hypothetical protein
MKQIVFIFIAFVSFAAMAQETKVVWDYPAKPGTKEWVELGTVKQRLEACQIPQEILSALSTKELVEICMNYPFYFESMLHDDERKGIPTVINNFNGLRELGKRIDGAKELMLKYRNLPVLDRVLLPTDKGDDAFLKPSYVELVLSTDEFIDQLSQDELKELQHVVRDRYQKESENMEIYSLFSIKKTFLLGAVAIDRQKDKSLSAEQQDIVRKFIERFSTLDPYLWTEFSKIISKL